MKMLIKGGRVLDPANSIDDIFDVLVEDGLISRVEKNITDNVEHTIDANGKLVMPGLIDLHAHLREPGYEHKETIRTGARAAARGGYTSICAMPDTRPVVDSVDMIEYIVEKAKEITDINILPVAAVTANQDGEYITDFESLKRAGAVAVTEDGKTLTDTRVARQAMRLAAEVEIPMFVHCVDSKLAARGVMNAGERAKELGLYGIMNAVEDVIVARDIMLAKNTGVKLHICHCSTEDAVELTRMAKERKLPITAETTPHHLILTDMDIDGEDSSFKTNPPIRSKADREALRKGLMDGTISAIATDHAPHHKTEKEKSFIDAPFGASGLETSVAMVYTELVKTGIITPLQMAEKMSYNPAKILGIDKGTLGVGKVADITIIDPNTDYIIDSNNFYSKGKSTPFNGRKVCARVNYTIAGGKVVYSHHNGNEVMVDKDVPKE